MQDDLKRAIGSVEAKVDILLERSTSDTKRIDSLEQSRSWFKGVLAVLGAAWAVLVFAVDHWRGK